MSHGIDVCKCGAVVMQCRCMGPHTKRVVCETCDACRSKPAPQPTTPAPTTASLHREMVEALRRISYERCRIGPGGGWCNTGTPPSWCEHQAARAAMEGWEKRVPLRDDDALRTIVRNCIICSGGGALPAALTDTLLGVVEAALYGERG